MVPPWAALSSEDEAAAVRSEILPESLATADALLDIAIALVALDRLPVRLDRAGVPLDFFLGHWRLLNHFAEPASSELGIIAG
jgi:hypothetical protein